MISMKCNDNKLFKNIKKQKHPLDV